MATVVLVYGGSAGGWMWREVATRLRTAGHEVGTPTWTGLGERAHLAHPAIDLAPSIQDVLGILLCADLQDVVWVGSSSGSVMIAGVVERLRDSASVSYGKATPSFPVLDLRKRSCHPEEQDDPSTARAKVAGQRLTLDVALQATFLALLAFSLKPLTLLLVARTAGNPFCLQGSVRTLIETGVLGGERGAYHPGQALPTIQVPATVQAVLATHIDRLLPEAKCLLQAAAAHDPQALAAELGMRPLVAHCHRGLGMLPCKLGRGAQARPELSAPMALCHTMERRFWQLRTGAALVQVEGR